LEQGFIGDRLLILKESGTVNTPFCCYDPDKISLTQINSYLDGFLDSQERRESLIELGIPIAEVQPDLTSDGVPVTGFRMGTDCGDRYEVYVDGRKIGLYYRRDYKTDMGPVSVFQKQEECIIEGDLVFIGEEISEDEQYAIKSTSDKKKAGCYEIKVTNGKVSHVYSESEIVLAVVGVLVVAFIVVFAMIVYHS
jgi:hypothetical protein